MYISYFCRLHLGIDYLKTGWLGLKLNAYVILLDIARFPSVVAIPFVFHQQCLRRLFPHSLSHGVWPNFGISAHLIGKKWYLVRILVGVLLLETKLSLLGFICFMFKCRCIFFIELSFYFLVSIYIFCPFQLLVTPISILVTL